MVRGSLLEKEAVFGTGERFNTVNQRGKIVDMTAIDIWCGIEAYEVTCGMMKKRIECAMHILAEKKLLK